MELTNGIFVNRLGYALNKADQIIGKVKENDEIKISKDGEYKTYVVLWDVGFQEYALMLKNDDTEEWNDSTTINGLIQDLIISYLRGQCDDFIVAVKNKEEK